MPLYYKKILYTVTILFWVAITSGCAINKVQIHHADLIDKNKKMFVYGLEDEADINSTVKNNLIELGFDIVENKDEARLIVDYNFECGWDLIHYTCEKFNLFVTDKMSNKIVFQSKFWGSTPLSAETLINMMFDKLENELDKTLAQQRGGEGREEPQRP